MRTIEQLSKELEPTTLNKEARLELRLNMVYKLFLKQVYKPAGFRSLSAFILQAAIEKAEELIEKEQLILSSEKDKEVFFNALLKTAEPNTVLKKASKSFKKAIK